MTEDDPFHSLIETLGDLSAIPYEEAEKRVVNMASLIAVFYGTLVKKELPKEKAFVLTRDWIELSFRPEEEEE